MSAKARDRKGDPRRIPISDGGKRSGDEDPLKSSSELAEERAEALLSASGTDGPAPEGADRDEEAGGDLPPAPELLEKLKRVKADFANYQRRMEQDRKTWAENGRREILASLLPAIDQLEITVRSADEHEDLEGLKSAVGLVRSEVMKFLKSSGVERMDPVGGPFDPEIHEALFSRPTDEVEPGIVLDEMRTGYTMGERVLRPSQVVVSGAPEAPSPPPAAEEADPPENAADDAEPERGE